MGHWRAAAATEGLPPSTLTDRSEVRNMRECNGEQGAVRDAGWIRLDGVESSFKNAQGKSSAKASSGSAHMPERQEPGDATRIILILIMAVG